MRITGYAFLLIGLLWLAIWFAFTVVPLPRSIFVEIDKKYPSTKMYSHTDVLDAVGGVMTKFKDNAFGVFIPTSLMLLGGVLIDRRRQRSLPNDRKSADARESLMAK